MKLHTLTYVGLYDDDSFRVVTRVASSYEDACKIRAQMLKTFGQPVVDDELEPDKWEYELEEGDVLHEVTHYLPTRLIYRNNGSQFQKGD